MRFALDYNRLYALEVEKEENQWRIRLNLPEGTYAPFAKNLSQQIEIKDSNDVVRHLDESGQCVLSGGEELRIELNGHRIGKITDKGGELKKKRYDRLTVSDTRLIGEMPEGKAKLRFAGGQGDTKEAVISDFHTHSSSEISGQDLVALGREMGACYPVRLLKEIGIECEGYPQQETKRYWFPPLEPNPKAIPALESGVPLKEMSEADCTKLAQALNMRADRQSTTGEMELDYYRLRTPLTKIPEIFGPLLWKVAENYARHGVKYAELTITCPGNADLLETLHREVPLIKEETGVDLRFLVGLPRTLPRKSMGEIIEKAKVYSESPYFLGIDIIGYEINKISDMDIEADISRLAGWMREHEPEFTLRVHAGENAKNPENIRHVLEIAEKNQVRVRIGHGIYGMDDATLDIAQRLAKQHLLVIEFNPDSNIAINNIDSLAAIPFGQCLDRGIPFVVGSDGSGLYQTSAKQLQRNLQHMGLDQDALDALVATQQALIKRQLAYSEKKEQALSRNYEEFANDPEARAVYAKSLFAKAQGISALASETPIGTEKPLQDMLPAGVELIDPAGSLPEALEGRKPILLMGASGNSWRGIKEPQKQEAAAAVDMLVRALDPAKSYFVVGRVKNEGVSHLLEVVLERLRRENGNGQTRASFEVMSLQTPDAIRSMRDNPVHLHFAMPIENNFVALAGRLVRFAKQEAGEIIAIGGSSFTRDIILKARHEEANFTVMSKVKGASKEKSGMLEEGHKAENAKALLRKIAKAHPECIRQEFLVNGALDEQKLQQLYERSMANTQHPLKPDTHVTSALCNPPAVVLQRQ